MHLTAREHSILRLAQRHRYIRSHQIVSLLGGSRQQILRRLQLLYHHGYLERPRAQLTYYHQGGSRHIVYGLGTKGMNLLKREIHPQNGVEYAGQHGAGRLFLEHALLVTDVMVAIELACRADGRVRLVHQDELQVTRKSRPFRWRVQLHPGLKLGVVPDQVFALEYSGQEGGTERAFFFLEADRGTMPVTRRNLSQTSFRRKLLAYEATWFQNLHRRRFGFHRFRVLTVTTNAVRMKSLLDACAQLKSGRGLFLFADRSVLDQPAEILSPIWRSTNQGVTISLLD
jgi:hypothetical protein